MEKNVQTVMSSLLHSYQILGKEYPILPNTTLNQKLNILNDQVPSPGEYPTLGYIVLGNGGLSVQTGADGIPIVKSYVHKPTDTGLFNNFPFIMRPVSSDLIDSDRAKYRLRRMETHNGINYFVYYGKIIDVITPSTNLEIRTVQSNGSVSSTSFIPSAGDLTPTPTLLSPDSPVTTVASYVAASTKIDFIINSTDVNELLNCASVIYGSEEYAIISEIGICSGVERSINSSDGGLNITYMESISTQIMSFLSTNYPASDWRNGIKYTFDVGTALPILSVS